MARWSAVVTAFPTLDTRIVRFQPRRATDGRVAWRILQLETVGARFSVETLSVKDGESGPETHSGNVAKWLSYLASLPPCLLASLPPRERSPAAPHRWCTCSGRCARTPRR